MDHLKLAQVLKPQGIKGEIKLKPFTDDLSRFSKLVHVFIKKNGAFEEYHVESARTYKQFAYVKLKGIDSIEQAETLRGAFLYIDRQNAAKLPEGSDYIADIIGCEISDGQNVLGNVTDIFNTGAADIYVVKGERPFMFPAAPGVILKRTVQDKIIIIDPKRLSEVAIYD